MDPPRPSGARGPDEELRGVPEPVRSVGVHLLIYKALFRGPWFNSLADQQETGRLAHAMHEMSVETEVEGREAVRQLKAWSGGQVDDLSPLIEELQWRLLEDLVVLKEGATEAFLLAAMRAPTDPLRTSLVDLADQDRRHADELRALLGVRSVRSHMMETPTLDGDSIAGAHHGRPLAGTLRKNIEAKVAELRESGQTPARIILSPVALRHARDEGLVGNQDGTALGIPVDIDFGWRGECFAIRTREHASLAELITAAHDEQSR